jgi:hypothetical protein
MWGCGSSDWGAFSCKEKAVKTTYTGYVTKTVKHPVTYACGCHGNSEILKSGDICVWCHGNNQVVWTSDILLITFSSDKDFNENENEFHF